MRVHVVDVGGRRVRVGERPAHRLDRPVAGRVRVGDPVRGERVAVAGQLRVDPRAARDRVLEGLEHEEARALAQHEAVAGGVERAARARGRVVVRRDGAQQAETGEPHRAHHRVEAPRERVVDRAAADQLHRRADGLPARRAGGVHARRVAADPVAPREQREPGGGLRAAEHHRVAPGVARLQPRRIDVLAVARGQRERGEVGPRHPHHAGADREPPARARRGRRPEARIRERLVGRGDRERVRPVRELEEPPVVDDRPRVEALHLGRDARREARGVEDRDRRAHAPARPERRPGRRHVVAGGRDEPEPGDRHPFLHR